MGFWSTLMWDCAEGECIPDAEACTLAPALSRLPGLVLRGVMGYEGHVVEERDRALRAGKAAEAMERLIACVETLERAGFEIEIVSAGGTNTYEWFRPETGSGAGRGSLTVEGRRELTPPFNGDAVLYLKVKEVVR